MAKKNWSVPQSERDRLLTRPDKEPLPTPLDPAGPRARGYPHNPKHTPKGGQGTDPDAGKLGHSA
jgi:hypothetical protein